MNLLKYKNNNIVICVNEKKEQTLDDLSKEDLITIFDNIYYDNNFYNINWDEVKPEIKNPVHGEIVNQIVNKIIEFQKEAEDLKQEIESEFPLITTEEMKND